MTKNIIPGVMLLLATACSDDGKNTPKDTLDGNHVWKEQTQTIDKAKGVKGMLEDAAAGQRKIIDEQAK